MITNIINISDVIITIMYIIKYISDIIHQELSQRFELNDIYKYSSVTYCKDRDRDKHDYVYYSATSLSKYLKNSYNIDCTIKMILDIVNIALINNNICTAMINIKNNNVYFDLNRLYVFNKLKEHQDNFTTFINSAFFTSKKKKILVDYSSPNIAKDMHVGHLRSTIIGDCLSNFFNCCGHEVLRINHVGDFGLQYGMMIQYILHILVHDNDVFLENNLQNIYHESKRLFDQDATFKANSYSKLVLLQNGDKTCVDIWLKLKSISKVAYDNIYRKLSISPELTECGESFYVDKIDDVIAELQERGILTEDNGRQIILFDHWKLPLTIVKSDGGYTYDTTDLVAIKYRLINLRVNEIYYVVDSGQSLHFDMLFDVARFMGWDNNATLIHYKFGLVYGSDGKKFKARSGKVVKLIDLIEEADIYAKKILDKNNANINQISEKIAISSIKYYDLSKIANSDYKYDLTQIINEKGNTGPYLLYTCVRIKAIVTKCKELMYDNEIKDNDFVSIKEVDLMKYILHFPDTINDIQNSLDFQKLTSYAYRLGQYCNTMLNSDYIINKTINGDEVNYTRLVLIKFVKAVIKKITSIIGIELVNKM